MARFISIDEILHRGRFAKDAKKAPAKEAATRAQAEAHMVTDSANKVEAAKVEILETPAPVEPTVTDAPAVEVAEVVTDAPAAEEANIVEEAPTEAPAAEEAPVEEATPATPKKKGVKKAKATEEAAE